MSAVAFDTGASGSSGGTNSLNVSITIGANANRYLIVHVYKDTVPSMTVTANGVTMTQLYQEQLSNCKLTTFGLKAPATGAITINVSTGDSRWLGVTCASLYNVLQGANDTSSIGDAQVATSTSSGPLSTTNSSVSGDMCVAGYGDQRNFTNAYSYGTGDNVSAGPVAPSSGGSDVTTYHACTGSSTAMTVHDNDGQGINRAMRTVTVLQAQAAGNGMDIAGD
jgi:hypothetical protein